MNHIRSLLLCTLICSSFVLVAQDLLLSPKWKKGDTRSMFVTRVQQETTNGELTDEISDRLDSRVKVITVTATTYMLEMEYHNVILTMAKDLTNVLGSEMDPWKKMILRYEVDRRTGEAVLYNWQDVRDVVNGSFNEIKRSVRKKDPELADSVIPMLDIIVSLFQERETVDAYFRDGIDMLTFAFNKPLALSEPLVITETEANPMSDGKDSLTVVTTIHLDQLDKEAQRCTIRSSAAWDMEPFMVMRKDVMMKMMSSSGVDKSQRKRSKAEIDKALASMNIEMTNERSIIVDLETTWPIRMESNANIVSNTPDGTTSTTMRVNAEIR